MQLQRFHRGEIRDHRGHDAQPPTVPRDSGSGDQLSVSRPVTACLARLFLHAIQTIDYDLRAADRRRGRRLHPFPSTDYLYRYGQPEPSNAPPPNGKAAIDERISRNVGTNGPFTVGGAMRLTSGLNSPPARARLTQRHLSGQSTSTAAGRLDAQRQVRGEFAAGGCVEPRRGAFATPAQRRSQ